MKKFNRVVVIAPTRSTCLNISIAMVNNNIPRTLLMQEKKTEIFDAVDHLGDGGFGIVAGTGTGKTVSIRDIAKSVLGEDLRVDVVTRENEATDYTWTCNVLVITPGVALHWLKSGVISPKDLLVLDEIHQTSEHLELAMALAKRQINTFVWMSATIDPAVYASYLLARTVVSCAAFDPLRRAEVVLIDKDIDAFLNETVNVLIAEKRSTAVFVSTRAKAEELCKRFGKIEGLFCDFYHGGEKAEKLRQFLTGEVPKPFMIFMTNAGSSSLNIDGLDTVVIQDEQYDTVVHSGVNVLEKIPLDNNKLLQMRGRVDGRALNGKVFIVTHRNIDFHSLKPETPKFVLGGDPRQVALVCARIGVDLRDLEVIGKVDRGCYESEVKRFKDRGIISEDGNLTGYGSEVERLPVADSWSEILVEAKKSGDERLLDAAIVTSSIYSLYQLLRKEHDLSEAGVSGSDHLTGYNIVASALRQFGYIREEDDGLSYAFNGDYVSKNFDRETGETKVEKGEFIEWCDKFGLNGRAIKEAVIAMKSVYRQLGIELLDPEEFKPIPKGSELEDKFIKLLAKVQSLDFVHNERNSKAGVVWAADHSMARAHRVLGIIRHWNDKRGFRRASVEGTEIPQDVIELYAVKKPSWVIEADDGGVLLEYSISFAGERAGSDSLRVRLKEVPESLKKDAEASLEYSRRTSRRR